MKELLLKIYSSANFMLDIPVDKLLHFIGGFFLYLILSQIFAHGTSAVLVIALIAIAREIIGHLLGLSSFDALDITATLLPAFLMLFLL